MAVAARKSGVASRRLVLMSTVFVLAACESTSASDSPAVSPSVSDESQTAIAVPSPTPIGDQGTKF